MFNQNNDFEELRFVLNSKIRSRLIISLFDGAKTLGDLKLIFNKPSSTILHTLHELTLLNLINKKGKSFHLSSRGYIFALVMYKFMGNMYVINKNYEFLDNHSLNSIPKSYLTDLYLLISGYFVVSEDIDLAKPLNEYLGLIKKVNELNIILPIFSQIHLDAILKNIKQENNAKLTLITTSDILKSLKKSGYMRKLSKLSQSHDISIFKYDGDLDVFLSFGKNFSTLSLFFKDGQFDDSTLFIDKTTNGVKWSKNLFNYYVSKSLKVL
ncbi:MAG: DUF1724 domain-containing protein [archaeon]|nr:DUF1724 domain-containing protein [archaeon]